ncbi:MAG: Farnesyl diphosphate synthase [Wolbachia endosymbiont of Ctenocephalides orientis wCori]|nr:MAG: Farnesyl diphosphate synthase [Wolbachia endosymbiont of Ctenocephalides orientis wCori]
MLNEEIKNLLIVEIDKLLPENKQNKLISAMRYMLFAPAKYIRPFLVIGSFQIFNDEIRLLSNPIERVLPIAIAIEFIHVYSLIHDDLPCMDNSDTRRGQNSCHKEFDEATAVLVGDALLTLAFEILSSLDADSDERCRIIKVLSEAIGLKGMVGGQVLDIDDVANKPYVTLELPYTTSELSSVIPVRDTGIQPANVLYQNSFDDEGKMDSSVTHWDDTYSASEISHPSSYMHNAEETAKKIKEIHLMKTAKLFAASCEIGAIMGGATYEQQKALRNYGENLGLIFQAQDDMKDYGQEKTSNLVSVLGKDGVKSYIEELFKKASNNLNTLSRNVGSLYELLNKTKKDG